MGNISNSIQEFICLVPEQLCGVFYLKESKKDNFYLKTLRENSNSNTTESNREENSEEIKLINSNNKSTNMPSEEKINFFYNKSPKKPIVCIEELNVSKNFLLNESNPRNYVISHKRPMLSLEATVLNEHNNKRNTKWNNFDKNNNNYYHQQKISEFFGKHDISEIKGKNETFLERLYEFSETPQEFYDLFKPENAEKMRQLSALFQPEKTEINFYDLNEGKNDKVNEYLRTFSNKRMTNFDENTV